MTEINTDLLQSHAKLLVVDDVPANLKVLAAALGNEYDVIVATSGPQCLELAAKAQPELILLDISMPGMDGLQVCQKLKSDPQLKHIPVVFATAMTDAAHESKGLMLGAADFIQKPYRIEVVRLRIRNIIDRMRLATLINQQHKELQLSARLDALTKLPNRAMFDDRLNTAMGQIARSQAWLATVFLDLDGFKTINDEHGHLAGDHLLKTLALRLQDCVRQGDTVARLGGDEFVALINHLEDKQDCLPLLERMLKALSGPVKFDLETLRVSASMGVAFYCADDLEKISSAQLLEQADQAMYRAKRSGKNRYAFFGDSPTLPSQPAWSRNELEEALRQDQLELVYSPELKLSNGKIESVEALLRWNHPNGQVMSPASFLPTLQHHPLSIEVGRWVLRRALSQLQDWAAQGLDLRVTVNIGAHHLMQTEFAQELRQLLDSFPGCQPDKLMLDIHEISDANTLGSPFRSILRCAELGVLFSLDDFGTGQSSLTLIRHLPLHQIKVDPVLLPQGLTAPAQHEVMVHLVGFLKAMGFSVLAEGIETQEQIAQARDMGFDSVQGHAINAHLASSEVADFVRNWQPLQQSG